jgi:glucokinase
MTPYVIGADLGGTKIELGLVDPQDRIIARQRIPTQAEAGSTSVVERIAAAVSDLSTALPAGEKLTALGMCTPGPVDHVNGVLLDPPNVQGLHHAPLGPLLQERLGIPVQLEHDAKAAALGEFYFGAGRGEQSMVYIIVGTGVGAALIMDGAVYRGMHNSAGELGHTVLDRNGLLCSCGNRGCIETFLSGPRLAQWYGLRQPDARPSPTTGEEVALLAAQGDRVANAVLTQAGEALGAAIATLAMIVNIDLYVVGGSVAKCGELLLAPARRAVPHHAFASVAANVRIVASGLDTDAPILGCAWLARQLFS